MVASCASRNQFSTGPDGPVCALLVAGVSTTPAATRSATTTAASGRLTGPPGSRGPVRARRRYVLSRPLSAVPTDAFSSGPPERPVGPAGAAPGVGVQGVAAVQDAAGLDDLAEL